MKRIAMYLSNRKFTEWSYYSSLVQYQKWSLSAITVSLFWYNQDNLQLVHKWPTLAFVIVVAATTIKKLTSQTTRNPKTKNWKPKTEGRRPVTCSVFVLTNHNTSPHCKARNSISKIYGSVCEICKYGNDHSIWVQHLQLPLLVILVTLIKCSIL